MIPYGKQNISQRDIDEVINVLKSNFLTQGPKVPEFEKKISQYVDANHCVAVNSATSALHIACLAIGIKENDIVWTVPNTFVASSNAALYCGATIDFVDIDLKTNNICILELKRKLEKAKQNNCIPKALIPVHLGGLSCNMVEIAKLSKEFGFKVIEDASHCIGGDYQGKKIGSCEYSDLCVFSFHPVKIITTAEGGAITTNSETLYSSLNKLRSHGITKESEEFVKCDVPEWYYQQKILGFNYRMTDIQASLGITQLERIDNFIEIRRKIADLYIEQLSSDFAVIDRTLNFGSSNHLFILKSSKRDMLRESLSRNGIFSTLHYFPVHLQPYYTSLGFKKGDFPNSEEYGDTALSIPIHPGLSDQEINKIINHLKDFN